MAPTSRTPFAIRLSRAREAASLSPEQAAVLIGTSLSTYRRWERGTAEPSISQLVTAAVVCNTTPAALLEGTESDAPAPGIMRRILVLEGVVGEQQEALDALTRKGTTPGSQSRG